MRSSASDTLTFAFWVSTSILAFPRLASLVTRSASRAATAACAASSRGFARIELFLRLGQHLFVDDLFLHHLGQTFYLGVPADDFGLILSHVGFRFGQLGDRRLDVALGHHHQLLGLLDETLVQVDLRHLSLMVFVQLGNEYLRQQIALFHLLADVHVEMLDEPGDLGENRGLLEGIDESGLIDGVVDGP